MEPLTIASWQTLLSMLSLEGIKALLYRFLPTLNINPKLYTLVLPVLGLVFLPLASWLSGGPFSFALWTEDMFRQAATLVFTTLGAMFVYNNTLKPQKEAIKKFNAK